MLILRRDILIINTHQNASLRSVFKQFSTLKTHIIYELIFHINLFIRLQWREI